MIYKISKNIGKVVSILFLIILFLSSITMPIVKSHSYNINMKIININDFPGHPTLAGYVCDGRSPVYYTVSWWSPDPPWRVMPGADFHHKGYDSLMTPGLDILSATIPDLKGAKYIEEGAPKIEWGPGFMVLRALRAEDDSGFGSHVFWATVYDTTKGRILLILADKGASNYTSSQIEEAIFSGDGKIANILKKYNITNVIVITYDNVDVSIRVPKSVTGVVMARMNFSDRNVWYYLVERRWGGIWGVLVTSPDYVDKMGGADKIVMKWARSAAIGLKEAGACGVPIYVVMYVTNTRIEIDYLGHGAAQNRSLAEARGGVQYGMALQSIDYSHSKPHVQPVGSVPVNTAAAGEDGAVAPRAEGARQGSSVLMLGAALVVLSAIAAFRVLESEG